MLKTSNGLKIFENSFVRFLFVLPKACYPCLDNRSNEKTDNDTPFILDVPWQDKSLTAHKPDPQPIDL